MPSPLAQLAIRGDVHATLYNADGSVAIDHHGKNLVVDGGLLLIAKLIAGQSSSPAIQMIAGAGTNVPTPPGSLTALDNQPAGSVPYSFAGGDITTVTAQTGQSTASFNATWSTTQDNFTINEVGLFATGPLLIARYVFPSPGIPKTSSQTLKIVYTLTFQAS